MRNKLIDLNNHLFLQLERVNDEALEGEKLEQELERSKAVVGISKEIISNARTAIDAEKLRLEYGIKNTLPEMLENK